MKEPTQIYETALSKLREDLRDKRGYAPRIAFALKVKVSAVYNVAHGRKKDARILKALVAEATKTTVNESLDIISDYLSSAA